MVQGGSRLGFLFETTQTISIVGETGWEDFDRDPAIEAGIERAVDLTHAACPERTEDLIRTERGPRRKAHYGLLPLTCRAMSAAVANHTPGFDLMYVTNCSRCCIGARCPLKYGCSVSTNIVRSW